MVMIYHFNFWGLATKAIHCGSPCLRVLLLPTRCFCPILWCLPCIFPENKIQVVKIVLHWSCFPSFDSSKGRTLWAGNVVDVKW